MILFTLYLFPIYLFKKFVTHHVLGVILRAEALFGVFFEDLFQKTSKFWTKVIFHRDRFLSNIVEETRAIFVIVLVVWRRSSYHLVEEGAQAPPINRLRVSLAEDDLGGEVLWGAAVTVGAVGSLDVLL